MRLVSCLVQQRQNSRFIMKQLNAICLGLRGQSTAQPIRQSAVAPATGAALPVAPVLSARCFGQQPMLLSRASAASSISSISTRSAAGSSAAAAAAADRPLQNTTRLLPTSSLFEQQPADDLSLAEVGKALREAWRPSTHTRQWPYIGKMVKLLPVYGPRYNFHAIGVRDFCSRIPAIAEALRHEYLHGELKGYQIRATEIRLETVGMVLHWLWQQKLCTEAEHREWYAQYSAGRKLLRGLGSVGTSAAKQSDAAPAAAATVAAAAPVAAEAAAAAATLPMPTAPTAAAAAVAAAAAPALAPGPSPPAPPGTAAQKGFDKIELLREHIAAAPIPLISPHRQHALRNTPADTAAVPTTAAGPGNEGPAGFKTTAQDPREALRWLCCLVDLLGMDHEPYNRCQVAMMQLQGLSADQLEGLGPNFWPDYQVLLMSLHAPEAPTGCEDLFVDNVLTSLDRLVGIVLAHESLSSN